MEKNLSVEDTIKKIISEKLTINVSAVSMKSKLVNDLGADSLDIVEMILSMEDAFNLEIPEEEVAELVTVKDTVEYIKSKEVN